MLDIVLIKEHLRLEADQVDEDALLLAYGRAAWRLVENKTNRALIEGEALPPESPANALLMADDLRLAMLMLVAHWYRNREAVTDAASTGSRALPLAVDALVGPYRWFSV